MQRLHNFVWRSKTNVQDSGLNLNSSLTLPLMVRPELLRGLEAVLGKSVTLSKDGNAERLDPSQLHAALLGSASGYARSSNLEQDEVEPGESESASRERGRGVMSDRLLELRKTAELSSVSRSGGSMEVRVKVVRSQQGTADETQETKDSEFSLQVHPELSISELKAMVQDREDVPLWCQRVVFAGQIRDDNESLSQMGVESGNTLYVTVMPNSRVFVKELDLTTYTINISLSETVAVLKERAGEGTSCH